MGNTDLTASLTLLEPTERHRVMDLVAATGVSIESWAVKRGGLPVANPAANPAFCYEWAFGEESEPVVLCVWHETLVIEDDRIVYRGNLRRSASELESRSNDRFQSDDLRSRAKSQAKRARDFDIRCQDAWRLKRPVRLILLKGERASENNLGRDSSKVEYRLLDSEPWMLASYDMFTGEIHLVRGESPAGEETSHASSGAALGLDKETIEMQPYLDQFDMVEAPQRREVQGSGYIRSALVRAEVLRRAAGVCEACGDSGFRMANGAIYLETHHVVPLSQSGPDVVWNVVAVCANDHRVAHFGELREEWRSRMIDHLSRCYPKADVTRGLSGDR